MKKLLLTSGFLLAVSAGSATAQWEWLYPTPQGNDLYDVVFLDNATAIAVGEVGTVLVSHDAGLTWTASNLVMGRGDFLVAIAATGPTTAVIAGSDGRLINTRDAGASWEVLADNQRFRVTAIDFLGELGFMGSPEGLQRSTDGGRSWTVVNKPPTRDVCIASASVIYAASDAGILKSEDGGQTWSNLNAIPSRLISCADAANAVVLGGNVLTMTHDGGQSWATAQLPIYAGNEVDMADANSLFVAGFDYTIDSATQAPLVIGALVTSRDSGATWSTRPTPQMLRSVTHSRAGVVLAVGDAGVAHVLGPDGSWQQTAGKTLPIVGDGNGSSSSAFADRNHGLITESRANYTTILATSDSGHSWQDSQLPGMRINDVAFSQGVKNVYAVGSALINRVTYGTILSSSDGGSHWTSLFSDRNFGEPQAIAFSDKKHAIAVGNGGSFAVIDNNRITTGLLPEDQTFNWFDVAFADARTAVAVGGYRFSDDGFIGARTEDGGLTWKRVLFGFSPNARAVAFATQEIGVVAVGGELLRTTDAGQTWGSVAYRGAREIIYAIAFANSNYGIALGGSELIETNDGGLTWKVIPRVPTHEPLTDVTCLAPFQAIVTGGGLLALDYHGTPWKKAQPLPATIPASAAGLTNEPNPFNPSTTIRFTIERSTHVRLSIYDAAGRRVVTLIDEFRAAGAHEVAWNGMDGRGERVASGVYFDRLEYGDVNLTRKMILLK